MVVFNFMIGIYKITSPTKKIYIGQSINIERRFETYKKLHCKKQLKLYRSFLKYGTENHTFEIVEECKKEELNSKEQYYQFLFDCIGKSGLNCKITSSKNISGRLSNETKEKISKTLSGQKRPFMNMEYKKTKEWKEKMSKSMLGKKHSSETKQKMSKSLLGNKRGLNKKMSEKEKLNLKNCFSKIILDTQTGVFYTGTKEASIYNNIPQSTLKSKLNGSLKNNTNLIYC